MISSIANLVYELPHELPNHLSILGNKEILGKYQIWAEKCGQSPLQKLNLGNSSHKTCKSRYQTFLVLFSFTGFLYIVPNILPRIVDYFEYEEFNGTVYLICLRLEILFFE